MPEQLRKQNVEEKPVPASTVESKEAKKSPEIVEDLVKVREKLLIQKSHGAVRIAGEFLTGNLTREETKRGIARIPDREPLVKKALERLEQMGFIHWAINPEKKTKVLVVDIKKITERKGRNDRWFQNLGGIFHHKAYGKGNKTDALYEIFRDKNVISQEDLDRKIYKEKPLFYIPESKNHAITPEEIKKTDFHIGLWDVIQKSSTNREFPIKEGRGLTWLETRIALFLFHPRFGDGYRDDKGIFMVRDPKTRKYHPLSWEGLSKYGFSDSIIANRKRSVRGGIRELLPNLINKKLLRSEDFRALSGYQSSETERASRTKVTPVGYAMFNGVRHYLGREFVGKPIRIYELSKSMGGIAEVNEEGKEELRYTFRIFTKDNSPRAKGGEAIAGRKHTELTPFSPERVSLPRRADETEEEYKQRIESVQGFSFLLRISSDLEPLGIALHKEEIREQMVIAKAARFLSEKNAYQRFLRLAKTFGEDGVRSFFTTEYDSENGEKILEIGEKLETEEAEVLFYSYARIIDSAREFERVLREKALQAINIDEELKTRFPTEVHEAIIRRSKDLLMAAHAIGVERVKTDITIEDVKYALEGFQILFEVLQSLEDTNTQYRLTRKDIYGSGTHVFSAENKTTGELYDLKIFVRPRAEPGKEARINIRLNFDTIKPNEELRRRFRTERSFRIPSGAWSKKTIQHELRLAIDRDSYDLTPLVSLDTGAATLAGKRIKQEGNVLGNILALTTELGHHNKKSFDKRFSTPEIFEEIASKFRNYIEEKMI